MSKPKKPRNKKHKPMPHAALIQSNPLVRSGPSANWLEWLKQRKEQCEQFNDGDNCAEFLAASLETFATCLTAMQGFSVPQWIVDGIVEGVEACRDMASNGHAWSCAHGETIWCALEYSVKYNRKLPFMQLARGVNWARTATAHARSTLVEAA